MGRDSILDDADRNRQQNEDDSEPANESPSDTENDEEERVRLTQRMSPELAEKVDAVQERYQLPSRNATINFILNQGTDQLLDRGEQP
jgi:hypothetical protein